jgi:hypothetical protein
VLRAREDVVRRKVPTSLPTLAYLRALGRVEITNQSPDAFIEQAIATMTYQPDAYVMAEAIRAKPDWFVTHEKIHFLSANPGSNLAFRIGTPGDVIQSLADEFAKSGSLFLPISSSIQTKLKTKSSHQHY